VEIVKREHTISFFLRKLTFLMAGLVATVSATESADSVLPTDSALADTVWRHRAVHLGRTPAQQVPAWQQVALLYGGQWAYYLTFQGENVRKNGSFHNWYTNMPSPHFDKDSYDFNLIMHSGTGALYYGYYRAYGNSLGRSLALSTASVLLFEFTVESVTERPSFQDIYQTPILGALVGMSVEQLSLRCLSSSWKGVRGLGYLLNPYTMVPGSAWQVKLVPVVTPKSAGGHLALQL